MRSKPSNTRISSPRRTMQMAIARIRVGADIAGMLTGAGRRRVDSRGMIHTFADKVVLVTGGAAGIGRATALAFARAGARLAIVDIHEQAGREVVEAITADGGEALFIRADVAVA